MASKKRNTQVTKKNKRQSSLAEKTEKILLSMPRVIAFQIGKDLTVLKQREDRLKKELKKSTAQYKKLDSQLTRLGAKDNKAAKKQYKRTQKTTQSTAKLIKQQTREIELVQKQFSLLALKRDKYNALQIELKKFEKEWNKAPVKKIQKRKRKKTIDRTDTTSQAYASKPSLQKETIDIIEIPLEQVNQEPSEVT